MSSETVESNTTPTPETGEPAKHKAGRKAKPAKKPPVPKKGKPSADRSNKKPK